MQKPKNYDRNIKQTNKWEDDATTSTWLNVYSIINIPNSILILKKLWINAFKLPDNEKKIYLEMMKKAKSWTNINDIINDPNSKQVYEKLKKLFLDNNYKASKTEKAMFWLIMLDWLYKIVNSELILEMENLSLTWYFTDEEILEIYITSDEYKLIILQTVDIINAFNIYQSSKIQSRIEKVLNKLNFSLKSNKNKYIKKNIQDSKKIIISFYLEINNVILKYSRWEYSFTHKILEIIKKSIIFSYYNTLSWWLSENEENIKKITLDEDFNNIKNSFSLNYYILNDLFAKWFYESKIYTKKEIDSYYLEIIETIILYNSIIKKNSELIEKEYNEIWKWINWWEIEQIVIDTLILSKQSEKIIHLWNWIIIKIYPNKWDNYNSIIEKWICQIWINCTWREDFPETPKNDTTNLKSFNNIFGFIWLSISWDFTLNWSSTNLLTIIPWINHELYEILNKLKKIIFYWLYLSIDEIDLTWKQITLQEKHNKMKITPTDNINTHSTTSTNKPKNNFDYNLLKRLKWISQKELFKKFIKLLWEPKRQKWSHAIFKGKKWKKFPFSIHWSTENNSINIWLLIRYIKSSWLTCNELIKA